MSKFESNEFCTTDLVLNIMELCADRLKLDINDNATSTKLYDICCDLEFHPEDQGFGSSDSYSYVKNAEEVFCKPAKYVI